jgi:DNA-binding CsgD family transcriptional regulator
MDYSEPADGLIDRIYECAFVPEQWPNVLEELARIASARVGFLFVSRGEIHHWTSSTAIGFEAIKPLVDSGWIAKSDRFRRAMNVGYSGFLTEASLYPANDTAYDPFYRDILYPRGLGHVAGTVLASPTGDRIIISLEREFDRGPVEPEALSTLDGIRPHLARAATVSTRLQLERARATTQALEAMGQAALVFDVRGRVVAANALIQARNEILWRARDRLSLSDRNADHLLGAAIASIAGSGGSEVRSFPVRGPDGAATTIVHVVPIRLSARDIFVRCAGILALAPVSMPNAPAVAVVQSLFDLTPAEARVAQSLATGKTVADIASGFGTSESTVRSQVRGVLEKTGCHRQADVVALLGRLTAGRLSPIG